ncbi:asparagine synthase-related protein [Tistrella mobilis]|uniref:asparagine synthetase B family protein n=1 Tax=Tistrella mobilis TaxID=171437 RepID=UPI003556EB53
MTALAAFWQVDGNTEGDAALTRMLAAQAIYTPHARPGAADQGWADERITIGLRLNPSLPEDIYDRQPVEGAGGRFVMVADLRLDNREDLAQELGISADRLKTMADSDLAMAAFERWELDCVHHFYGDFAFVVWDVRERRLLMARDHLGARPLHYHAGTLPGGGRFFAVATMPRGLLALPWLRMAPDMERLNGFLALLPELGTNSFFEGIERLLPGHRAVVTADGGVRAEGWWNPAPPLLRLSSRDEYAEALRTELDRAVRCRLRGAGDRVATHLSSGLDSSSVTATAARLIAPGRVTAYTSTVRPGYDDRFVDRDRMADEWPLASATARLYPNVDHVRVVNDGTSPIEMLGTGFQFMDRPILNPCNHVWMNQINDMARKAGHRVVLSGQMGNMSLSYDGYTFYPQLFLSGRFVRWFKEARGHVRAGGQWRWRGMLAQSIGPALPSWAWLGLMKLAGRQMDLATISLLHPDRRARAFEAAKRAGFDLSYRPSLDSIELRLRVLRRVDGGNYHKAVLAGWGLDSRDPTSDIRLIEFAMRVPDEIFVENGGGRALARRAMTDRLPREVLAERRRGLQAPDWHEALTAKPELLDSTVEGILRSPAACEMLDTERLKRLHADMATTDLRKRDAMFVYRLAMLRGTAVGDFIRRASGAN